MGYTFLFDFTVRGRLIIEIDQDDEHQATTLAEEALTTIALGDTIYPNATYTIDQRPELTLDSREERSLRSLTH